jgi:hypothetical protein
MIGPLTAVVKNQIIKDRKLVLVTISTAISYAFAYLSITGALFYFPNGLPGIILSQYTPPSFELTPRSIAFVPTEYVAGSITYEALLFLVIVSSLFGLSMSLLLVNRRMQTSCGLPSMGMLGIIPATITTFSCCGGGMLALAFGPAVFTALTLNSQYFLYLSTISMFAGTFMLARRVDKQIKKSAIRTSFSSRSDNQT